MKVPTPKLWRRLDPFDQVGRARQKAGFFGGKVGGDTGMGRLAEHRFGGHVCGSLGLLHGGPFGGLCGLLRAALAANDPGFVHETPLETLSLTNLTECGTAYSTSQIAHYAELAHAEGLNVHLDGARLANALASTDATPAEMSWPMHWPVQTLHRPK